MANRLGITILFLATLFVASCGSEPDFDQPPDIRYGEDTCERCLMIINEARYAAAYVTTDGEARRFDDVGGMVDYHKEMAEDVAVFWVHDYDTEEWLKAESAHFVTSDGQYTPMGYGIVAFGDSGRVKAWAAEQDGMAMSFVDLLAKDELGADEHDHEN
jgi:copper chaperone NosL